ncbi:MAG TPA: hypothetical protein VF859_10750 [Burkholderiales bacterium]
MTTADYPKLTLRNGFAVSAEPTLSKPIAPPVGKSASQSCCDRSGRLQLMREAYAALLRKERAPAA